MSGRPTTSYLPQNRSGSNPIGSGESVDGLPKQFVSSLRILFDILDENRTGFVRLKDIESRWSDDGVRGLPAGVVDGLRRVTPQDGLLSFEKFVAGLKLVLNTRRGNDTRKPFASKENRAPYHDLNNIIQSEGLSRESRPYNNINDEFNPGYGAPRRGLINNYHNTVQESAFILSNKRIDQRHSSDSQAYPGRLGESERNTGQPAYNRSQQDVSPVQPETDVYNAYTIKADVRNYPNTMTMGNRQSPSNQGNSNEFINPSRGPSRNPHYQENPPALPPRSTSYLPSQMRKSHSGPDLHQSQSPPALPPRVHQPNSHVLVDLKNWQREWTANQNTSSNADHWRKSQRAPQSGNHDNNAIYANIDQFQRRMLEDPSKQAPQKATVRRHGSGRRHTLTSGIDQNMLKRMKQLEDEKTILQSGMKMVDTARDWYQKQLSAIMDKQAMLGKVSYNDNSLEAHAERMSFQRARVAEVNQQLSALVDSSEKGFPLHMNLAMTSRRSSGDNEKALVMNRNRKLMEETNHKTNQISQLEKEKASLIRDLFEARSKNKSSHDDTTFM